MSYGRNELFGDRSKADEDLEASEGDMFLGTSRLEQQQDEHLDAISASLKKVGQMANDFSAELRAQNDLLDDVGRDMDRTSQTIKLVESKTAELVEKAGGPGYFCITVVLSAIAFFLFLLIIYT